MTETLPPYSYKPLTSKDAVAEKLSGIVGRSRARVLFEAVADVIATVNGFNLDGDNELRTTNTRGPLTLTYRISEMSGGVVFSEAWGSDYIFDLVDKKGTVTGWSHENVGEGIQERSLRRRLTPAQRVTLAEDLKFVLDHSPSQT